jgi:hypothetical protein
MSPQRKPYEASTLAVILTVLEAHPAHLTEADTIRELSGDPPVFADHAATENRFRDLIGVGVLRREGDSILPTRPTIYLDEFIAI